MDLVAPLHEQEPIGRLEPALEAALARDPALLRSVARSIVDAQFLRTVGDAASMPAVAAPRWPSLCSLDHKLFDLGVLGLTDEHCVAVSSAFTARTAAGRRVYDLHGRALRPRRGTVVPAEPHVWWHRREVFKGLAVAS